MHSRKSPGAWLVTCMIAVAVVFTEPSFARAQGEVVDGGVESDDDSATATAPRGVGETRARDAFVEGTRAVERGDLDAARELFETSLELFPKSNTVFNLAVVERSLGRTRRAIERFEALVAGTYGPLEDPRRRDVERLLELARGELAVLDIRPLAASSVTIEVDGNRIGRVASGASLLYRTDRGDHVVIGRTDDGAIVERRVRVERSEHTAIALSLEESGTRERTSDARHVDELRRRDRVETPGSLLEQPPTRRGREEDTTSSPVPFILAGAGAAVLVAATIVTIALVSSHSTTSVEDPVTGVAEALRAP